ncbi:MAG: DUF2238 domain-containing protein [Halofilum sp. (in: g-proteobacteria)]|nr:DUF2238 domain-containing protein [Halofilum sp. (in: g-proteobacteria)]
MLLGLVVALDRRFDFSQAALWLFNAWMLLHLLGGMASVGDTRLYDYVLVHWIGEPYEILKYDQLVHVFCYVAIALLVHEAVSRVVLPARAFAVAVITVLAASGIGGLNEIIEFAAVVVVGSTGVGGYVNTALDLLANLLGALAGAALGYLRSGWRAARVPGAATGR